MPWYCRISHHAVIIRPKSPFCAAKGVWQTFGAASFSRKQCKPLGACLGDCVTSLCLPRHFIPASIFNEFSFTPATFFVHKFFQFLFMVRLLHKLGDANR